jgi:hypothetical protein
MSFLCRVFGHKRGPEEDGDSFMLDHLKLVNRVAPCGRCGARVPAGVHVETPDGRRAPLLAKKTVNVAAAHRV